MVHGRAAFGELPDGSIAGPDGTVYRRTPERVRRRVGNELIAAGASVVTDVYPEGLTWFDGEDAQRIWVEIAPRLIAGRKPAVRDLQWVGHVWFSDSGDALLRFEGEH